ncbi:hypothetical protein [Vibrio albus]|nr:hypothetical protein [Vibrio albus]
MRTIWVTGLTLMVLLLSGVSSSATLMPIQVLAGDVAITAVSDNSDTGCGSFQQNSMASEDECCNSDSLVPDHQCCPVTCVAGYPMVSPVITTYHQAFKLVPIPQDTVEHANSVVNTLYRPPII